MILRLSQDLARKVKGLPLVELPLADDPLTDWTARLFNVSRTRYILACNTRSLYSIVIYARGVNDTHELIAGVLRAIADVMEADGFLAAYKQRIVHATDEVRFGKAISRSVTGSINDLVVVARSWLEDHSPYDTAEKLNDVPLSALRGPDGRPYAKPRESIKTLIAL